MSMTPMKRPNMCYNILISLIEIEPNFLLGGRLHKSSNLKFLKNQIFAQHNVKQLLETRFQWFLFELVFPFWALKNIYIYLILLSSHKYKMKIKFG